MNYALNRIAFSLIISFFFSSSIALAYEYVDDEENILAVYATPPAPSTDTEVLGLKDKFRNFVNGNIDEMVAGLPGNLLDPGLAVASAITGLISGAIYSETCNRADSSVIGCLLLAFLAGIDEGENRFREDVREGLKRIEAGIEVLGERIASINDNINALGSQLNLTNLRNAFNQRFQQQTDDEIGFRISLRAMQQVANSGSLSRDVLSAVLNRIRGDIEPNNQQLQGQFTAYINKYVTNSNKTIFDLFAEFKIAEYKLNPQQNIIETYREFESFAQHQMLVVEGFGQVFSAASNLWAAYCNQFADCKQAIDAVWAGQSNISLTTSGTCYADETCRWSFLRLKDVIILGEGRLYIADKVREAKRKILTEFNRQVDRFVLSVVDTHSSNPEFTIMPAQYPYQRDSIKVIFGLSDLLTSTALREYGVRGRIISAGTEFNGALQLGANGSVTVQPINASETLSALPMTDYWAGNNEVYDTVSFGQWKVHRYYIPVERVQAVATSSGGVLRVPVYTPMRIKPVSTQNDSGIRIDSMSNFASRLGSILQDDEIVDEMNRSYFGSFLGIRRVGGMYALRSGGNWKLLEKQGYTKCNRKGSPQPLATCRPWLVGSNTYGLRDEQFFLGSMNRYFGVGHAIAAKPSNSYNGGSYFIDDLIYESEVSISPTNGNVAKIIKLAGPIPRNLNLHIEYSAGYYINSQTDHRENNYTAAAMIKLGNNQIKLFGAGAANPNNIGQDVHFVAPSTGQPWKDNDAVQAVTEPLRVASNRLTQVRWQDAKEVKYASLEKQNGIFYCRDTPVLLPITQAPGNIIGTFEIIASQKAALGYMTTGGEFFDVRSQVEAHKFYLTVSENEDTKGKAVCTY